MYKVIVEWHDQYATLGLESDFYSELRNKFPVEHKSKDDVENVIYGVLDNLSTNHYGLFSQQTSVIHKIIY